MTEIALYDLDRTITRRPTYTPFLLHAAWRHQPWRLLLIPFALLVTAGFVLGFVSRARLKEINHWLLLGPAIPPEKLAAISESFAAKTIADNVYPQALARIAGDRAAGQRTVLITASYAFYVTPLAARLGFDDLVATVSRRDEGGSILARIEGENCYGKAKVAMIEDWLARQGLDRGNLRVRFHSDSESDLPLFEWADEEIAVNPTIRMRRIAERRGWQVIAWG